MAFEEVNVVMLKNSVNNALSMINYNNSKEIIDGITNNDVWNNKSRDNFKRALNKLVSEKYSKLEKKLNSLLLIADKIEEYQELSKLNIESQEKLNEISKLLNDNQLSELENSENLKMNEELNKNILENETKMEVIINTINNDF